MSEDDIAEFGNLNSYLCFSTAIGDGKSPHSKKDSYLYKLVFVTNTE